MADLDRRPRVGAGAAAARQREQAERVGGVLQRLDDLLLVELPRLALVGAAQKAARRAPGLPYRRDLLIGNAVPAHLGEPLLPEVERARAHAAVADTAPALAGFVALAHA